MNLTYAETRDGMRKPLRDSEVGVSERYICQALNTTHWHERATGFYVTCDSGSISIFTIFLPVLVQVCTSLYKH